MSEPASRWLSRLVAWSSFAALLSSCLGAPTVPGAAPAGPGGQITAVRGSVEVVWATNDLVPIGQPLAIGEWAVGIVLAREITRCVRFSTSM